MIAATVGSLVYIALRLRGYADSCLWFDEVFSVHAAGMPWSELFSFVAKDIVHPPLSYILLKFWMLVDSTSVGWLRLFPILFSVLALVPVWLLMRDLRFGPAAVTLAMAFLAFNGTLIKYSQEVRMYALLFCFAAFSSWFFLRFCRTGKGFVALLLVNALLIYTHYFGWMIVLGEVLVIAVWQRIKIRRMLTMLAVEIALFAPWGAYVYLKAEDVGAVGQNIGWAEVPGAAALLGLLFDLTEPVYFQVSSAEAHTFWPTSLPVLLGFIALSFAVPFAWKSKSDEERGQILRLLVMFLFPIVCAFVLSLLLPASVWGTRHLLVSVVPLTMLIGSATEWIGERLVRSLTVAALVILFISALAADGLRGDRVFVWCAWDSFAGQIAGRGPVDVYLYEDFAAYQFWFSLKDASVRVNVVDDAEGAEEDVAYFLPRGFDGVRRVSESDMVGDEFYVAFTAPVFDDAAPPLRNLRARGYRFYDHQMFDGGDMRGFLVRVKMER